MDAREMNAMPEASAEAMPMKLDVRVRPIAPKNNLLAFASVTINDCFAVDGIKVVTGENGLFVNMPSALDSKGGYRDVCFPVTAAFRQQLTGAVLDGYVEVIAKMQATLEAAADTIRREPEKPSIRSQLNAAKETQAQQPAKSAVSRDDGAR